MNRNKWTFQSEGKYVLDQLGLLFVSNHYGWLPTRSRQEGQYCVGVVAP